VLRYANVPFVGDAAVTGQIAIAARTSVDAVVPPVPSAVTRPDAGT